MSGNKHYRHRCRKPSAKYPRREIVTQKKAEEKVQDSKTRRQDIIIKSDEKIEEEELQALFASHEVNAPRFSSNRSSNLVTPAQISILCKMHFLTMSGEVDDERSRSYFDSLGQEIMVAIFHSLSQLLESTKSPTDTGADFYTDSNTAETTRVVPFVKASALRIDALIEHWPEMSTLNQNLQRYRKFRAPTPDLITLFASYRRLELRSWAALIQTEISTFHSTNNSWWFRFYELLVHGYSTRLKHVTPKIQKQHRVLKIASWTNSLLHVLWDSFGDRLAPPEIFQRASDSCLKGL
ncbi:hypothetical protein MJO28_006153 [Puccinia striiformis f. sp. tritici]|uniref:Uncharacterized protein n=2 Tax=Puccinia striiformis TaxID=27350 RepID=A0A2S4VBM3_9BASI|nr:hypothetical protein MJO28_006153 [Puccinia striiformis f. sp. tritici]KAI7957941.1 hypothetical protein MJO29_006158 [Puccinia striiformis f. sp. tritici]POW06878.1 hypothetical protein PSHT_10191 [Puccinia striiformis]